ncbi:DNA repair protein RadA [Liquorilactobacillus vini]|uniref:DNA repair protein RadA n=2 Tax=Liquorilactobacillus vini TaxID=238015 RepID=A0A0R2CJX7_9LACO|nr:DNA repair protein RadA [Liquorilactobacillus vini]KRM88841.1 DNA repair protein RadA [Liquorilactobacillus vini DSM 20605]
MAKIKTQYVCQKCGYSSPRYLGKCPNCGNWNSLVEEVQEPVVSRNGTWLTNSAKYQRPQLISKVSLQQSPRIKTASPELNRVLGGGVVPGSLVLIGGDPGIGKSTLLMQVSGQLAARKKKVLYVSGEESALQIKLRAKRLAVSHDQFYLYPETNMQLIKKAAIDVKPDFMVIDSVQTMQEPDMQTAVGSVSQIREVTAELMQLAKSQGITIFIVGHVTKGGAIAGPKILEHMVDTVLYFEGDLHHTYRILRAVKNRFGSTNEIGIFEMKENGLQEVLNPSEIFLEERLKGATGSAVVASLEGTRPILVEVQSLVTPTAFGNAKRTTTGLDHNRVSLIMAVLEKRAGLLLQNQDAYFKAAGGVKLDEPAIDLGLAISIVSSYRDQETQASDCFIGELGLTGEIRRVNRIDSRVAEAAKLGFKRIFIPKNNFGGWQLPTGIEVVPVITLNQALKLVFNN